MEIVKLRTRKNYPDASNHVLVGSVIEFNDIFIRLKCRSFHYKQITLSSEHIVEGSVDDRVIPWSNVECMSVLPDEFLWEIAELSKCDDGMCLKSDNHSTLISRYRVTHQ